MKNNKRIMLPLMLAVSLSLVGCGNTSSAFNENMDIENTEAIENSTVAVETTEQTTNTTEMSADIKTENKNSEVAETTPEPTQKPTPQPSATPETTATPEPHTHDFKVESTVEATCASEGKVIKVCECGEKQTEAIPATGNHNWVEEMETVVIPSTGHVETSEVQVQVGTTRRSEYECAYCGARFDSPEAKDAHQAASGDFDHAFARTIVWDYDEPVYEIQTVSEWIVDIPEQTTVVGTGRFTCSVCGQQRE